MFAFASESELSSSPSDRLDDLEGMLWNLTKILKRVQYTVRALVVQCVSELSL
jgi:hypothetical protein